MCYQQGANLKVVKNDPGLSFYLQKWGPRVSKWEDKRSALMLWSRNIRIFQGGYCKICGIKEKSRAHHIFFKSKHPKLAFNINNGIILCIVHEKEVHNLN